MRVVGVKGGWVEDETHTTVLFDGLGEVGARGGSVLGELEEVATTERTLALIIVHS